MNSRSRPPRGSQSKDDDAHEERDMWSRIVTDLKRLKAVHTRAAEVSRFIVETEDRTGGFTGLVTSLADLDALQTSYREGVKLAEEEQRILTDDQNGVLHNVGLLSALRNASELEPPRVSNNVKPRNLKRKLDVDGRPESPGPSPANGSSGGHPRFKGVTARGGSVPFTPKEAKEAKEAKDGIAKAEDGPSSGSDGARGAAAEKAGLLVKNAEVAYKQNRQKGAEGDWIQCIIISVSSEGKNKPYEVQDPEPDEHGAPGQIYRASAASLVRIPPPGAALPEYPKGKQVLARYPDTTTFYRAEVMGMRRDTCRLKFEGEEEIGKEMDVDRRYVLDYGGK